MHVFNAVTSLDTTVTQNYAASPAGVTIGSIAEKMTDLDTGNRRHSSERTEGQLQEPTLADKLKHKLHIGKDKDTDDVPSHDKHGYTHYKHDQTNQEYADNWQSDNMRPLDHAQLSEIMKCGAWRGTKPSELFLNVYAQALLALDKDILNGMVSPSLMGSTGVVPFTIISVIPDIIAHHADLITRAEHEIFLATNFWEASTAAHVITDAMRELSNRVVKRGGKPVVMKLMYDRGNPKQAVQPHQPVDAKTYTGPKVKLPWPEDIPGIQLEVQNYHVPPVGTFHSKYMVVDRKVAIINSNNIQDRVNVEMMVHLEGPIVQSFYDMALLSWWNEMDPPLPLLSQNPQYPDPGSSSHYQFGTDHPLAQTHGDLHAAGARAFNTLSSQLEQYNFQEGTTQAGFQKAQDVSAGQAGSPQDAMVPGSQPEGTSAPAVGTTQPLKNTTNKNEHWDRFNAEEAIRVNSQLNSPAAVTQHLNTGTPINATDTSTEASAPFQPIILNEPHDPVPMAMVNRPPRGRPGHGDTIVPQDQAWLAGFKFARKNVFIQTPTFNAKPVVAAALEAVKRGILVEIYADLGFNDEGELLPFQGGTNEMVAQHMYAALDPVERPNLRIYWYTGKDQATPINATHKSRNCHVKLMLVDDQIAIQGNGNQDSQSWYHSQEINVLIDSPQICVEWRKALDRNQNTKVRGLVSSQDGMWRDPNGNLLPGTKPPPSAMVRPFVGVKGAIQRVRGEGGFAT